MTTLEAWQDGFVFSAEERLSLRHSSRHPAIYLGEPLEGREESSSVFAWKGLGACSTASLGEGHFRLRFTLPWELETEKRGDILHLQFRPIQGAPSSANFGLRLRFGSPGWPHVHGFGPSACYDFAGKKVFVGPDPSGKAIPRLPVAFGEEGNWLCVSGRGSSSFEFSRDATRLSFSAIPEELALGLSPTPGKAMASLTAYRGLRDRGKGLAVGAAWGAEPAAILRVILSYSFSGEPMPYVQIEEGGRNSSKLEAARMRFALEMAAFAPAFSSLDFEANADPTEAALYRRSKALFELLSPYRQRCVVAWAAEGLPLWSHPGLRFDGDPQLWERDDQFLFGPDLFVAPSLGAESGPRRLRLPLAPWVHLWTSRRFSGGPVTVDAPLGLPAVFYRLDSPFAGLFDEIRKAATRL